MSHLPWYSPVSMLSSSAGSGLIRLLPPGLPAPGAVLAYWIAVGRPGAVPPRETFLPDACSALVFVLDRTRRTLVGAWAHGAIDLARSVALPGPGEEAFGIGFGPGGMRSLLGLPPGELAAGPVPIEAMPGVRWRELGDSLALCQNVAAMRGEASRFIARLRPPGIDSRTAGCLRLIMAGRAGGKVADMAWALGYSGRHLNRLVQEATGFPPKTLSRIARLQRALRRLREPAPDLGDLALSCGYFDEAHLCNEFRAMVGLPPGELLRFWRECRMSDFSKTHAPFPD